MPISLPNDGEKPQWGPSKRFDMAQYPGVQTPPLPGWGPDIIANFSEGVLVGYRWYDAKEKKAAFPFGYGLTYTDFEFKNFKVTCTGEKAVVSMQVLNTGSRDGAAVPQVYIGFRSLRPMVRQLRGFKKVWVAAGGLEEVMFVLGEEDWSFYDEVAHKWSSATKKGEQVTVSVGSSSADLHWHSAFSCQTKAVVK